MFQPKKRATDDCRPERGGQRRCFLGSKTRIVDFFFSWGVEEGVHRSSSRAPSGYRRLTPLFVVAPSSTAVRRRKGRVPAVFLSVADVRVATVIPFLARQASHFLQEFCFFLLLFGSQEHGMQLMNSLFEHVKPKSVSDGRWGLEHDMSRFGWNLCWSGVARLYFASVHHVLAKIPKRRPKFVLHAEAWNPLVSTFIFADPSTSIHPECIDHIISNYSLISNPRLVLSLIFCHSALRHDNLQLFENTHAFSLSFWTHWHINR